jgi:hypothetical protein
LSGIVVTGTNSAILRSGLSVSGTTRFEDTMVVAATGFFNSASILNNLFVTGGLFISSIPSSISTSGSVSVSGNINVQTGMISRGTVFARAIIADGTNIGGSAVLSKFVSFQTTDAGATNIVGGNMDVNGTQTVYGNFIATGNTNLSNLIVTGNTAVFRKGISVSGTVNMENNLIVGGTFTNTTAFITDLSAIALGVTGVLSVSGETRLEGNLRVGQTIYADALNIVTNLSISGGLHVLNQAAFSGNVYIEDNLVVTGTSILNGLTITGLPLIVESGMTVTGSALIVKSGMTVTGKSNIQGDLSVSGTSILTGLTITGSALVVQSGMTITGTPLIVESGMTVTGKSNIQGDLSVSGISILTGLTITGTPLIVESGMTIYTPSVTSGATLSTDGYRLISTIDGLIGPVGYQPYVVTDTSGVTATAPASPFVVLCSPAIVTNGHSTFCIKGICSVSIPTQKIANSSIYRTTSVVSIGAAITVGGTILNLGAAVPLSDDLLIGSNGICSASNGSSGDNNVSMQVEIYDTPPSGTFYYVFVAITNSTISPAPPPSMFRMLSVTRVY